MSRRLVITADDLGREPGTTEVIAELLAEGNVSATTLITVSPHAADAARGCGSWASVPRLHVTLTGERGLPALATAQRRRQPRRAGSIRSTTRSSCNATVKRPMC